MEYIDMFVLNLQKMYKLMHTFCWL